jgi:GNAT superfamily N-acetyltransferase
MCDHWMPTLTLSLTLEQFHQLPRNSAYKYEYLNGQAVLSPTARHYHALLDLTPLPVPDDAVLRPVRTADWADLAPVFAGAIARIQPYGSLDDATRHRAAEEALERTRSGGDGPLIEQASLVALYLGQPVGAIFTTLLPDGDPSDFDSYHWLEPPPPQCIERRLGRPHLTWIFVSPLQRGHGTGTALLAACVRELLNMGFTQLLTTFMIGNDSSTLWHWRNGFRLLAHPLSKRLMKQRWEEYQRKKE